jgi:hypothetical protein
MKHNYFPLLPLMGFCVVFSCKPNSIPYTQEGNWAAEAELNGSARSESVSFVIDNFAYVGTGWDGLNTRFTDFWKYDELNNIWSQVNAMPGVGRSSAIAFSVLGHGYVGTGYDGYNILSDFYQFDTGYNEWKRKADFPGGARYEAVAFSLGNLGYAGTGFDGNNAQKDFYQYDPLLDRWTDIGFSGNKRYGALVFTYQNQAYLVTGVNNGIAQTDFWKFDPSRATEKWAELRHISNYSTDSYDDNYTTIARWNASAFIIPPYAYISTGENGVYYAYTWQYDFAKDLWAEKTPFEGPAVTGAVGFTLNPNPKNPGGGGFIGTGRIAPGQAAASDYLWQFFPDQTQNPDDN